MNLWEKKRVHSIHVVVFPCVFQTVHPDAVGMVLSPVTRVVSEAECRCCLRCRDRSSVHVLLSCEIPADVCSGFSGELKNIYRSPPLIGTPLTPNNPVLIRGRIKGIACISTCCQIILFLIRELSFGKSVPLREGSLYGIHHHGLMV